MAVKKVDYLNVRLPRQLTLAIERERKRLSRQVKTELKTSDVARSLLEEGLKARRSRAA